MMKHYHIKNYLPQLKALKAARASKRRNLIRDADSGLIRAIGESARNCLKGNVPLNRSQFRCLKKHKHSLRRLANKRTPLQTRKRIIQKGGFIGSFLGPIIKAIGSIFGF